MAAAAVLKMKQAQAMVGYLAGVGKHRDSALVAVCCGFGLRVSDALELRWSDVFEGPGQPRARLEITEHKTGQRRTVQMFPFTARALLGWWNAQTWPPLDSYIFPAPGGEQPLSRVSAWRSIKAAATAMGLTGRISPHSLRKAFCDFAYSQTRDPVLTARVTGHSNPAQLLRYIGRVTEQEEAVWTRMAKELARS